MSRVHNAAVGGVLSAFIIVGSTQSRMNNHSCFNTSNRSCNINVGYIETIPSSCNTSIILHSNDLQCAACVMSLSEVSLVFSSSWAQPEAA